MNIAILQSLQIDEDLKGRLELVLTQFDSYRIGKEVISLDPKSFQPSETSISLDPEPIDVAVAQEATTTTKKRRFRFLERLFLTEYNDEGEEQQE